MGSCEVCREAFAGLVVVAYARKVNELLDEFINAAVEADSDDEVARLHMVFVERLLRLEAESEVAGLARMVYSTFIERYRGTKLFIYGEPVLSYVFDLPRETAFRTLYYYRDFYDNLLKLSEYVRELLERCGIPYADSVVAEPDYYLREVYRRVSEACRRA